MKHSINEVNAANKVHLIKNENYNTDELYEALPKDLFSIISPGDTVVLKPNWVLDEHQYQPGVWLHVITNPTVITAVLRIVVEKLKNKGHVIITDGPELNANFQKILSYQPIQYWMELTSQNNITLEIIDLREILYIQDKNVTIEEVKLPSDPRGKVTSNLIGESSEFHGHVKSSKGYHSGGSDIREANKAHDGFNNLYSISRSVVDADVFINLPKLKTHKKGGITCSLKNLVGINVNRNYLPHSSIGTPKEGGDQFNRSNPKSIIESALMPSIHQYILNRPFIAKLFSPIFGLAKVIFGDNRSKIRGGSWFGNDTIWRMILDINKVFFYANSDGTLREGLEGQMKKYISIVDAIVAGEGEGPKAPDPVSLGYIIAGTNPVAVDSVCARVMNFDSSKIPSIENSFKIKKYPLAFFEKDQISIVHENYEFLLKDFPTYLTKSFVPHRGWVKHIEI